MNTNLTTASAKVKTTRNAKGHFQRGYTGTMIRHTEERQRRQAQVANNTEHQAWLAAHGLSDVSPDEIFAA